jgi:hypothetical protein
LTKDKGPASSEKSGRGTHVPDSVGEALKEIRRLYFKTTKATIDRDFDRAVDLLKAMPAAERERATVFMQGLAEMRKEFQKKQSD